MKLQRQWRKAACAVGTAGTLPASARPEKDAPEPRAVEPPENGRIVALPVLCQNPIAQTGR